MRHWHTYLHALVLHLFIEQQYHKLESASWICFRWRFHFWVWVLKVHQRQFRYLQVVHMLWARLHTWLDQALFFSDAISASTQLSYLHIFLWMHRPSWLNCMVLSALQTLLFEDRWKASCLSQTLLFLHRHESYSSVTIHRLSGQVVDVHRTLYRFAIPSQDYLFCCIHQSRLCSKPHLAPYPYRLASLAIAFQLAQVIHILYMQVWYYSSCPALDLLTHTFLMPLHAAPALCPSLLSLHRRAWAMCTWYQSVLFWEPPSSWKLSSPPQACTAVHISVCKTQSFSQSKPAWRRKTQSSHPSL